MREGDWVIATGKKTFKGEHIRGYIEKFYYDHKHDYAVIKPMNTGIKALSFKVGDLELDNSRHPDDVSELIDWALLENDREYFNELMGKQVEHP